MVITKPLSNLQIQLLKSFHFEVPDNQLEEIKSLLSNYFASKATSEMDKLWEENHWNQETMENWADEHLRSDR